MASSSSHHDRSVSAELPHDFKTHFHPHSNRPPLFQYQNDFGCRDIHDLAPDAQPWHPFTEEEDYQFAEIALQAGLNTSQVNSLLALMSRISQGKAKVTLRSEVDLRFASYQEEDRSFPVYGRSLWDWALDLLSNPLLVPHFVWDAQQLFKYNGTEYEQFYTEPWTGNCWWDIQMQLPCDVENTVPFAFILYADQTRLSFHGSVKGYPVVARCANLLADIRNGERYSGGCIVGWLPIVPEPAKDEGKLSYTTYKRVIWHEAFLCMLKMLIELAKTGYCHVCYDEIIQWLFPIILILSADYEELCMMCLLRGTKGKRPCPVCLTPLEELSDLSKTFEARTTAQAKDAYVVYLRKKSDGEPILKALGLQPVENVFWKIPHSEPEAAASFDPLHYLHQGVWGYHLLEEIKIILNKLPQLSRRLNKFPSWRNLARFNGILHLDSLIALDAHTERTLGMIEVELLTFGNKLKEYIVHVTAGNPSEHLKTEWNFPKIHLWKHVVCTRPNEKMHGALKGTYQDRLNGKDVAVQILRVDNHCLAMKLIKDQIDAETEHAMAENIAGNDGDIDDEAMDILTSFEGHVKLCAPRPLKTIPEIMGDHVMQPEFQSFGGKLANFINQCLPVYLDHDPRLWVNVSFPETFQMDWREATDYIHCNPLFHGKPRYDAIIFQISLNEVAFAHLEFMFSCDIPGFGKYDFALVRPLTAAISANRNSFDEALRLTHVKARPHTASMFIPIRSIVQGALLYPDLKHKDEFLVVEHIDGDMFLRMKEWSVNRG
ncbi:hypothetical protein L210DRAFT_3612603 [Boletus edulis BED1]|uniref:Uncharacterized protein n=1 Tax=Boletus edulis BED1 TaxID=1328754 RepID=A0AAD4GDV6_BOLED|nr:hypothetical protein L210DRAFT_3612603 [Boletus edulis BED1]